jgi:hypothetical protein
MELVHSGRTPTEMVEIYDTPSCPGCGGLLASPHVLISHLPCSCVPGGHRSRTCLECGHIHYEPKHGPAAD